MLSLYYWCHALRVKNALHHYIFISSSFYTQGLRLSVQYLNAFQYLQFDLCIIIEVEICNRN